MKKDIMASRAKGFTLVEIMIVVAIIVLLAAIAIPNLMRARLNANEATAIASMKTLGWAATAYRSSNSAYPSDLTTLANSSPAYVDSVLGTGTKQGYSFNITGGVNIFNATAIPVSQNITGVRAFYTDVSGVIRASTNGTADSSSSPIG
jgi:type IV pilus assembly protein PilA